MSHLKGKTVIITGGGRSVLSDGRCGSIGYGIATAFAKEGANLVLTGRNLQKLLDAKEELENAQHQMSNAQSKLDESQEALLNGEKQRKPHSGVKNNLFVIFTVFFFFCRNFCHPKHKTAHSYGAKRKNQGFIFTSPSVNFPC